ncbi:unnamed protein product [Soboliphyme baturini]|uniref:Uncharacterized protein n=1 Tax=Soboliphyme baturini TaxID=241478 RepID=A0A183IKD7_9BILA|nr:unnamed protein product [Soboliphyme baturini]
MGETSVGRTHAVSNDRTYRSMWRRRCVPRSPPQACYYYTLGSGAAPDCTIHLCPTVVAEIVTVGRTARLPDRPTDEPHRLAARSHIVVFQVRAARSTVVREVLPRAAKKFARANASV